MIGYISIARWPGEPMLFDSGLPLCEDSAGVTPWKRIPVPRSLWYSFSFVSVFLPLIINGMKILTDWFEQKR
jgi:hypothetical protein